MSFPVARLVRFDALAPTPWANGFGETVELVREPAEGDLARRLSIATVGSDAPFSALPGVDRAFMALGADGVTLRIGASTVALARFDVTRFRGEDAVHAVDVMSPALDLNLMVRRGGGTPVLGLERVHGALALRDDHWFAIVAVQGALRWHGERLEFGDTLVVADGAAAVHLSGNGAVAVARVVPA